MARLRKPRWSEDEDSDYGGAHDRSQSRVDSSLSKRQPRTSPRKKPTGTEVRRLSNRDDGSEEENLHLVPKLPLDSGKRSRQIRLAPLKCLNKNDILHDSALSRKPIFQPLESAEEQLPRRRNRTLLPTVATKPASTMERTDDDFEVVETEIEESVWCGSDTAGISCPDDDEDDLPSPRKFLPARTTKPSSIDVCMELTRGLADLQILDAKISPPHALPSNNTVKQILDSRPSSSSDKENDNAVLKFSPPRLYSPSKQKQGRGARDVTPPPSPLKGKLQSPSKQRVRMPTPPHRPSIGAFWDPQTVNDWNDQYSPRKDWKSPKKLGAPRDDTSASPSSSPRKASPTKRTRAEIEAKKDWESRKHYLAESFLTELDQTITSGEISALAAPTGGVKLTWSKTLKQTAGRANWRNEKTRAQHLDGSVTVSSKHHASIELAEKVIDDETRLLNVLAHEFCHLCNFMISGIKDQPHGKQFKEWGRKASRAFADRGIEVTTKHTYAIEYKYVWRCTGELCGAEFKRHSKSIDPLKQRCGSCKSSLVQIKPVPRKDPAGGAAKVNGYAAFVKAHYALVKKEMQGSSQKEVMEAVARKYRSEKAMAMDEKQLEVVEIDRSEVDHVARKLEFTVLNDR
nr:hmg box-containing protein c19g7.04 [Quercus suber]